MGKILTGNKRMNFNINTKRVNARIVNKSPAGVKRRLATDARVKLIQKKNTRVVSDAREVLVKLAKNQDARNKLNKLRQRKGGITLPSGVKIIGHNIVQKTDRHGNITLATNKAKPNVGMNAAIRKELGLVTSPPKKAVYKRAALAPRVAAQSLRQTVLSDMDYATAYMPATRMYDPALFKWPKPATPRTAASQLISSLETRSRLPKGELYAGWQNYAVAKASKVSRGYVDLDAVMEDEDMPLVAPIKQTISLQGSSRISNVHSRLDSSPMEPETHGILAQPRTKVVVPAGHRIVVSNLQSTVTQDDVKELFEDIGQLLAARLVRPGVAEVIYKNLKDAQKAVDTYHNRQLDGQPMKCLLVNKRPLNNPTAPPLSKMDTQGIVAREISPTNTSSKLVPDLSTIHKVLFQRK